MTLLLVPIGRGNWTPMRLEIPRQRNEVPLVPIETRVGQRVVVAGRVFRISKVLP